MLEEFLMPAPSLFLHDFTVLDFAFVDAERGILGESFYVSAELLGEPDEKDFILDFSVAKKTLKALVDDAFDHKLLVPMGAGVAKLAGSRLEIRSRDGLSWDYECPRPAYELFPDAEISAGVLEYHLARLAMLKLPANVKEARFKLSSPARLFSEPSFRYTHGLRYHDGNCQRLFHGHRNPVEVWVGDARDPVWEQALAAEWHNAHFVALPTLLNRALLDLPLGRRQPSHPGVAELAYESAQGLFRASLPASRVILVDKEPSIETMSELAAKTLQELGLRSKFKVVAYEGLNKGAAFQTS